MALAMMMFSAWGQPFQVVYSFTNTSPANPHLLVAGSDGNLYGATSANGPNHGAIFKVTTNGVVTTLASFNGTNGTGPSSLFLAGDGNLYGTTQYGGTNGLNAFGPEPGYGTLFKLTTNGVLTSLFSFNQTNGEYPNCIVTGPDGNLYGTTSEGGVSNDGTFFQLTSNGTFNVLLEFVGTNGTGPDSLVLGPDGNFYGATGYGGTNGNRGTLFRVTTNGVLTSFYSFGGTNYNGVANPNSLIPGPDGDFYGTFGYSGTVFKLTTNGVFTIVMIPNFTYSGGNNLNLVFGANGNLYGTLNVFMDMFVQVTTNGVPGAGLTTLYTFTNGAPSGVTLGADGNFYGTTINGGLAGYGTVFRLTTNYVLTSLYSFNPAGNGAGPGAALIRGLDGNYYGTTTSGGLYGQGVVFQMTTNGTVTALYPFTGKSDGANPSASLIQDASGVLYGTTQNGGANYAGTVFAVTTNGNFSLLYTFTGNNDGANPNGLAFGPDGRLYGTTQNGGSDGYGTVFAVTIHGAFTLLYTFTGGDDGGNPTAGLTLGNDGNFYGTAPNNGSYGGGTVFEVTTDGIFSVIYAFTYNDDGGSPGAGLTLAPDGSFYGTAQSGGANFAGTVFDVTTNGVLTPIYQFTGGNDGADPVSGVVLGADDNLYGTAQGSGGDGYGTVYAVSTNGGFGLLYAFTGGADGGVPGASLTPGLNGDFYGAMQNFGANGGGLIYHLNVLPVVLVDITNQNVVESNNVDFSASVASPARPTAYQWYYNGVPILNATNVNYATAPLPDNADGNYELVITNIYGSTTSSVASVTVWVPTILGITNDFNGHVTLACSDAPGSTNRVLNSTNLFLPMAQWQPLSTNIPDATGIFQVSETNNLNFVSVSITNVFEGTNDVSLTNIENVIYGNARFYRLVSP